MPFPPRWRRRSGARAAAPGLSALPARTRARPRRRIFESLEELLIQSDIGVDTALKVTANIAEGRYGRRIGAREIRERLAAEIASILEPWPPMPHLAGGRGRAGCGHQRLGKTTTIGELASQFRAAGKSVVIAAGDTFRAAAVEQLQISASAPRAGDDGGAGLRPASLAFAVSGRMGWVANDSGKGKGLRRFVRCTHYAQRMHSAYARDGCETQPSGRS